MAATKSYSWSDQVDYVINGYWFEDADPRTKDYPLMNHGLVPILSIVGVYMLFIKVIGPGYMRNREPFKLKGLILAYNSMNVIANVWFFFASIYFLDYGRRLFDFEFPDRNDRSPTELRIIHIVYFYFCCKLFDLLDTVFFVLRKKSNQVTFLHLYHHSIVPLIMWMGFRVVPTAGPAGMFPLLNSFIHAVMYTYYGIAALGPKYRKYLFWKKYITVIQLAQFVIFLFHGTIFLFLQQGYPKFLVAISYIQLPLFLYLFYKFFRVTYIDVKKPTKKHE